MHEYSIVEQMVEQINQKCREEGVEKIKSIRLKRYSTFAEEPLQQAFEMLTPNTPLQEAELVIEEFRVENTCKNCGFHETIGIDDLLGHIYICSECGTAESIDEHHGLEILSIETE